MTEEQVKECLSRNFVYTIANHKKFKCTKPENDNGVDVNITKSVERLDDGRTRLYDSGLYLDIQLKSTTENSVIYGDEFIKFDLEVKNYNDLIERRDGYNKLILILYILPVDNREWVNITDTELIMKKHAYWYYPEAYDIATNNVSTQRINIPTENRLDSNFFNMIFDKFYLNEL